MNIVNKVELKLQGFDKCQLISDHDCPIGQIYDYASAVKAFCVDRMKEAQEAEAAQKPEEESAV